MAIQQPQATDKLNSPSHSLSHRVFANDNAAPAQAIVVDSAGNVGIGTTNPSLGRLQIVGSAASSLPLVLDSNATYSEIQGYNGPLYINRQGNNTILNSTSGNVGIGTTTPSAKLDVNSDIIRLRTAKTPATAGAAGNAGDICWDASYVYVCVATNTWKRSAIATW